MLCQPSTGHHSTASALNSVSTTCSVRVLHGAAIAGRALQGRLPGGPGEAGLCRLLPGQGGPGAGPCRRAASSPAGLCAPSQHLLPEGRGCGYSTTPVSCSREKTGISPPWALETFPTPALPEQTGAGTAIAARELFRS